MFIVHTKEYGSPSASIPLVQKLLLFPSKSMISPESRGIAFDANGDIYVLGQFAENIVLPGATGNITLTASNPTATDAFIAKLDKVTRRVLWYWHLTGISEQQGRDIAVDQTNNLVYVIGHYSGTPTFVSSNQSPLPLAVSTSSQMFLAAWETTSGAFQWINTTKELSGGGGGKAEGHGIAIGKTGMVYATGLHNQNISFTSTNNTSSTPKSFSSPASQDVWLAQWDTKGALQEIVTGSGTGIAIGKKIAVDSNGQVSILGEFTGVLEFTVGSGKTMLTSTQQQPDLFLARWVAGTGFVGAVGWVGAGSEQAYGLAVDGARNIYAAGSFQGSLKTTPPTSTLTSKKIDAFVAKVTPSGSSQWLQFGGGAEDDEAHAIAVTKAGELFLVGYFQASASFGAHQVQAVKKDAFIAALDTKGMFKWVVQATGPMPCIARGVAVHEAPPGQTPSHTIAVIGDLKRDVVGSDTVTFTPTGVSASLQTTENSGIFVIIYKPVP